MHIPISTALQWCMVAGTTPKSQPRSRPTYHILIIIRQDTNFWHRLQISAPSEIKTQRNRINCMRLYFPKGANLDRLYIYQRVYIRLPRCDQGIVHKIGPRNRHWGAFAKRCINNRTIRHDAKGKCQSCIVLERCTFGEVSRMLFILFLLVFISDGALIWRRCQKFVSGLIILGIWRVRRLLRWNFGVVPMIIYHFNAVPVQIYLSKFLSYHLTSWTGSAFAVHYIGQKDHEHKIQNSRNHNIYTFWQIQHKILS